MGNWGQELRWGVGMQKIFLVAYLVVTFPMCENPTSYYQDREGHMFAFPVILVARIWTWAPLLANETKASSVLLLLQIDLKEEFSYIALGCEHLKSWTATAVLKAWGCLRLKANILRMAKWKDTHYLHFQSYHWPTLKCEVRWKLLSSVWLFVTPWTVALQALPPMGFPKQEHWSGLLFSSPGLPWGSPLPQPANL